MKAYRIKNWGELYENNRTRELKSMLWVPVPVNIGGDGYATIMEEENGKKRENGPAIFGTFIAIVEIAANCPERGLLVRSTGDPHTVDSLSRQSRIKRELIDITLRFCVNVIKWIEIIDLETDDVFDFINESQEDAEIPQDSAGLSQDSAGLSQDSAGLSQDSAGLSQDSAGLSQEPAGLGRKEGNTGRKGKSARARKFKNKGTDDKIRYLEYVYLKPGEREKLAERFGEYMTAKCIEYLDQTIPNSKKARDYTDHYRAILKWVANAVQEKYGINPQPTPKKIETKKVESGQDEELGTQEDIEKFKKSVGKIVNKMSVSHETLGVK